MAAPFYNPNYYGEDVFRERQKRRLSKREQASRIKPETNKATTRPESVVGMGDRFMGKTTREPKRPSFRHVPAISETPSSQAVVNNVPSTEQASGGPETPYVNQLLSDLWNRAGQAYQSSRQEVEQTLGQPVRAPIPGTGSQIQSATQKSATNQDKLGQGARNANAASTPDAGPQGPAPEASDLQTGHEPDTNRTQTGQITLPFGVGPQRQRSVMAIDPETGQMRQVAPGESQNEVRLIQEPGKVPMITNKPFEGDLAQRRGMGGPGRGQRPGGGKFAGDGYYIRGQHTSPQDIDQRARAELAQEEAQSEALTPEDRRQNDINQLQADLAYMRSRRRMNPEMNPPGLEGDIEAAEKRLEQMTSAGSEQGLQRLANRGAIEQQRLASQSDLASAQVEARTDLAKRRSKNQREEVESQREMRGNAMDYVNEAWEALPFEEKQRLQSDAKAYQQWRKKTFWDYYDNVNNFQHLPNPDQY